MTGLAAAAMPVAGFVVGLLAGAAFFLLLRRNAVLYLRPQGIGQAIGLQALRLAVLAAVLVLLARQGALPLLLGALGVLAARQVVLRLPTGDARGDAGGDAP